MKNKKIEPRLLKGFRDYLPHQMIPRLKMIETIRKIYESYGFVPLDTPAIEDEEVLLGEYGDQAKVQVYTFTDRDNNRLALRYDLTVPLSRVVAMHPEIPLPFKRYQFSSVWRMEKTRMGRYREFMQFDADIVGVKSLLADAEIISVMYDTLKALGIERFIIRINHRKLLDALLKFVEIPEEKTSLALRSLDKMERIGWEGVRHELTRTEVTPEEWNPSFYDEPDAICLGLSEEKITKIENFLAIKGDSRQILSDLWHFFKGFPIAEQAISELEELNGYLEAFELPFEAFKIDLSIARGLAYYTGPVFETTFLDAPEFGSVFSGGRYDNLIGRFTGKEIPATGTSIGVDRLFAALEKLKLLDEKPSVASVLVLIMDLKYLREYLQIVRQLRQAGIKTELFIGDQLSLKKQLSYADKKEISLAIIAGPDEFKNNTLSIKDLRKSIFEKAKQKSIPKENLVAEIISLLKA